jgi:hypothetical protein
MAQSTTRRRGSRSCPTRHDWPTGSPVDRGRLGGRSARAVPHGDASIGTAIGAALGTAAGATAEPAFAADALAVAGSRMLLVGVRRRTW